MMEKGYMMRFDVNKICFLGMYSALLRKYSVNVSEEELLVGCKKITFEYHYVYENKKNDDEWKKSDYCYLIGTTDTVEKDQLLIYDGYVTTIPQTYFCGLVPADIIDKALWKEKHIDSGKGFGVTIYEKQDRNNVVNYRSSIFENAQSMLSQNNANVGTIGIKNLAINIQEWIEEWNDNKIKDNMRRIYHSITSRGGPAISRNVYAEFLYKNLDFLSESERNDICKELFDCAKKWNGIAVKAFRCSLSLNAKYIVQISKELQTISCIEHEIWGKLTRILKIRK